LKLPSPPLYMISIRTIGMEEEQFELTESVSMREALCALELQRRVRSQGM
jgi:hypothetical protein